MCELSYILITIGKIKISLTLTSEIRNLATINLTLGISDFSLAFQVPISPVSLKDLT
jgi:hypothetical protein